jgi:hypothetical protein
MAEKQTRRSLFQGFGDFLRRLVGGRREPETPGDPYAYRFASRRPGPNSRSGAAAVAEPEEENGFFPPRRR